MRLTMMLMMVIVVVVDDDDCDGDVCGNGNWMMYMMMTVLRATTHANDDGHG